MNIAIVSSNKYPGGDAGAVRQHAMAKLLQQLGHQVLVLGYGAPTQGKILEYDGVQYTSFRKNTANVVFRALHRYTFGHRVIRFLQNNTFQSDVLLIVDMVPISMQRIKAYAKKNNLILIHDSVEWYSPEEFSNGKKSIVYRNKEYTNTKAVGKGWRVICISKYLEHHFATRCDKVVRIPVIMDIANIPFRFERNKEHSRICFVYAGGPGRKDYLQVMIEGFSLLSDAIKQQVEFHIIGVTQEQLIKECGVSSEILTRDTNYITAHGRVSREEALRWVMKADFTLLLRDEDLRYAKAGFPTKVVESMACGTPVVCNISSDLGDYLIDSQNAYIIPDHTAEAVAATVTRIVENGLSGIECIRKAARDTAEHSFDYRLYEKEIQEIL